MRIRNGVGKDEALRLTQLKEYALHLARDMANQTLLQRVHLLYLHILFRQLNEGEDCVMQVYRSGAILF